MKEQYNKMELANKIEKLKKEKNAVILAHYYAPPEVQAVADYIGDSFYLAKIAKDTPCDVIVFCGVEFMGESAKILNPQKKVLMPDLSADCAMAHMATEAKIKKMREEYDDLAVVCYINSTAQLKCNSDVCVTSSNALKIVEALPNKNIFFIPDGNLGRFVKENAKGKNVILNDGSCPVHTRIDVEELKNLKAKHPKAKVLSHPECSKAVLDESDYAGSTAEIIDYSQKSDCDEFIICTERGVEYGLKRRSPHKAFHFIKNCVCEDMKKNTLEKLCNCLEEESGEVMLDKDVIQNSLEPLEKMLYLAK